LWRTVFDAIDHIWQGSAILATAALTAVLSRHPRDPEAVVLRPRWIGSGHSDVGRWAGKIGAHAAHHCFGDLGHLPHLQLNVWRVGVKGSGVSVRLPILSSAGK